MKYIDEYRDEGVLHTLLKKVVALADDIGSVTLMEVCGTHTVALFRSGLRQALAGKVKLLSGPGCPVCVTPVETVDAAVALAGREDVIVTTFGDMLRVPGTAGCLEQARAEGGDVRIVYSPSDAVAMALNNRAKNVVFIGVGFETTSPIVAATINRAKEKYIDNFMVLCAHKVIPPALEALAGNPKLNINGFICPGHVSVIIGSGAYEETAKKSGVPCVVTGFEPLDMLQGIYMLLEQIKDGRARVEVQYSRVVSRDGNRRALDMMAKVFDVSDSKWRGLGLIPESGYTISKDYKEFDAMARLRVEVGESKEPAGCRCGDVLTGVILPVECKLFKKVCTPDRPVGACMVSSEGSCAAYYKYGDSI